MTADEALDHIEAAGWGGVSLWKAAEACFLGCLLGPDLHPDYSTNLWDYVPTAAAALSQLAEKAQEEPKR